MRRTVSELWRRAVAEPSGQPAFLVLERGEWRPVGWEEASRKVDEIAAGFLSLGVGKGDRAAILCRTRLEWTLCDYALIQIGAVVVPIYPTSSAADSTYILAHSGARVLVCEDAEQCAKAEEARKGLGVLERVVSIQPAPDADLSLDELRERGRAHLRDHPGALEEARAAIGEEDVLTVVYTSGTTGAPKGCVLTHRNYWAMVDMITQVPGLVEPGDRTVLHLPLAHVFARLVEFMGARLGLTIAFCPDASGLAAALRAVRPTIFPSVPRLFETVHGAVLARFEQASGPRRRLAEWALAVGRRASRRRQEGWPLGPRLALEFALADRLVFQKAKARLGGRLRVAISGGAPLAREVAELFHALDILVLEGYGLTECTTVASVNRPGRYRFGTVGLPVPGVEIRIAKDGEILVRGENVFRGYHGDEEATRAVLSEEGWLATGDVGSLDADGFLTITDRKKDIIVTPAGKNVSPQKIENALKASRYVSQALVLGDRRPYLAALITLDREEVGRVARTDEEERTLIEEAVAEVNRAHGLTEQVKRFAILPRDFTAEEDEVTPTLKLRRRVCEEHFHEEIERLYGEPRRAGAAPAGS